MKPLFAAAAVALVVPLYLGADDIEHSGDHVPTTQQIAQQALRATVVVKVDDEGFASGFLYSKDGYIVTADHVVKDSKKVVVTFRGGKEQDAKVVGEDPDADVALLKTENVPPDAVVLQFADVSKLQVGDEVIETGNPFDIDFTITRGIVSAVHRLDEGIKMEYFQYDAATNPGNSGGPVVDADGKLDGLADKIAQNPGPFSTPQSSGIAYAVPASVIAVAVNRLALLNGLTL